MKILKLTFFYLKKINILFSSYKTFPKFPVEITRSYSPGFNAGESIRI